MSRPPPRRPQIFDADDPLVRPTGETAGPDATADADAPSPGEMPRHGDDDATDDIETSPGPRKPSATPPERPARFGFLSAFITAFFSLSALAIGLWFSRFVSVAVARDDWLGWAAKGLAGVLLAIVALFFLRELVGYFRLARLNRLRREAEQALANGDLTAERRVVRRIKSLASGRPEFRWALSRFRDEERHQLTPGALLALTDRVLLADADKEARRIIYESARRVAVVSAVVPIALVNVLFVLFENIRMVRRLAGTYGGRPGLIAGSRLLMRVIFHIAATGAVALTDDLFGQFLGQDVVRRLSARLGEGAFNGALTARLGIVAIELCRPCPYIETKPLRARHVVGELFPEFSAGELIGRAVGRKPKLPQRDED